MPEVHQTTSHGHRHMAACVMDRRAAGVPMPRVWGAGAQMEDATGAVATWQGTKDLAYGMLVGC